LIAGCTLAEGFDALEKLGKMAAIVFFGAPSNLDDVDDADSLDWCRNSPIVR
jgi:hypothetical protein